MTRGKEKIAIEVKDSASPTVASGHGKGLKAIAELPGLTRRILIYSGKRVRKTSEGIEIWPFEHFAREVSSL